MQQLVLLLIIGVLLADSGVGNLMTPTEGLRWLPPLIAFGPPLLGLLVEMILVRRTLQEAAAGAYGVIHAAGRRLRLLQWIAVVCTIIAVLGFGWLDLLRTTMGGATRRCRLLYIQPF